MNSDFDSFRYVQELQRKGATSLEIWKNILKNKNYSSQMLQKSTCYHIILPMWRYLLDPKRIQEIRRIEQSYQKQGKSCYAWWEVLLKCSPNIKIPGFACLRKLPIHPEILPLCLAGIRDEHWIIQRESAFLLGKLAQEATVVVPYLLDIYPNSFPKNQRYFFFALKNIFTANPDALDFLVPLLSSSELQTRRFAVDLFRAVKHINSCYLPQILSILNDSEESVRLQIILLLSEQSHSFSKIIPALFDQFILEASFRGDNLANKISGALNALESRTRKVVPYLKTQLFSTDPTRKISAIRLLRPFKSNAFQILPLFSKLLQEENTLVQNEVIAILSSWDVSVPEYADRIYRFQQQQEKEHTEKIAQNLQKIKTFLGPLPKKTLSTKPAYFFETIKKYSVKHFI